MTNFKLILPPTSLLRLDAATEERPLPLQLTPEAIDDFRECPYRFARTHVENLPVPRPTPGPDVVLDRLVHSVLGEFFRGGGWGSLDEEALLGILGRQSGASQGARRRVAAAVTEAAESLLKSFHRRPYPAAGTQDLAIEQTLIWQRFHKGILASAIADRVCQLPDGTIEVIDYRAGGARDSVYAARKDTQVLFLRSLVAEAYQGIRAPGVRVTVVRLAGSRPASVDFDQATFARGWAGISATADRIRDGFRRVIAGERVATAFAPAPGPHCATCPIKRQCERLRLASPAA